jgi:hypothetical protein
MKLREPSGAVERETLAGSCPFLILAFSSSASSLGYQQRHDGMTIDQSALSHRV